MQRNSLKIGIWGILIVIPAGLSPSRRLRGTACSRTPRPTTASASSCQGRGQSLRTGMRSSGFLCATSRSTMWDQAWKNSPTTTRSPSLHCICVPVIPIDPHPSPIFCLSSPDLLPKFNASRTDEFQVNILKVDERLGAFHTTHAQRKAAVSGRPQKLRRVDTREQGMRTKQDRFLPAGGCLWEAQGGWDAHGGQHGAVGIADKR